MNAQTNFLGATHNPFSDNGMGPNMEPLKGSEYVALWNRIRALRFYTIGALAKEVKGGTLGMDINRAFTPYKAYGGIKGAFAHWILANMSHDCVTQALPLWEKHDSDAGAEDKPARTRRAGAVKPTVAPAIPQTKEAAPMNAAVMPNVTHVTYNKPAAPAPDNTQELAQALAAMLARPQQQAVDVEAIISRAHGMAREADAQMQRGLLERIREEVSNIAPRPILVTVRSGEATHSVRLPQQHKTFDKLLKLCGVRDHGGNRLNIWMTGPAGSGKTTAAANVAKSYGIPFEFTGAVDNEFKLLGFIDAGGKYVRTAFREAYENGGVFLLDEVDGCHPSALLALNAGLANGHCDFPDGKVTRHKDCIIIAAANTWGNGATHEYVGRTKLDAASLDRFIPIVWDYDEELERNTCGNKGWAVKVQAIRARIAAQSIKHIVSPRASYMGAALLAEGFAEADVMDMVVRKGLPVDQWNRIKGTV